MDSQYFGAYSSAHESDEMLCCFGLHGAVCDFLPVQG